MRAFVASVAALVALPLLAYAQDKPTTDKQEERPAITVTGCLNKSTLKVYKTDAVSKVPDSFHLYGSKDLMNTLKKDYNGHTVEISGSLSDPTGSQGTGHEAQIGKNTRVYAGTREVSAEPPAIPPSIEVFSFRDVAPRCTLTSGDLLPR